MGSEPCAPRGEREFVEFLSRMKKSDYQAQSEFMNNVDQKLRVRVVDAGEISCQPNTRRLFLFTSLTKRVFVRLSTHVID